MCTPAAPTVTGRWQIVNRATRPDSTRRATLGSQAQLNTCGVGWKSQPAVRAREPIVFGRRADPVEFRSRRSQSGWEQVGLDVDRAPQWAAILVALLPCPRSPIERHEMDNTTAMHPAITTAVLDRARTSTRTGRRTQPTGAEK